eukprot:scaffold314913_cov18-Prasinocladus_malaysianus.AAC.1
MELSSSLCRLPRNASSLLMKCTSSAFLMQVLAVAHHFVKSNNEIKITVYIATTMSDITSGMQQAAL